MSKSTIGFVGLGAMGFGMATHLVRLGYDVHGFDVSSSSTDRFEATGGKAAASLRESALGKQFYICMVASPGQAEAVLFGSESGGEGVVDALPQSATILLCSTVPASYARSVADGLNRRSRMDIKLIDSPVSGGAKRAAEGNLSIMASGTEDALSSGRFLLEALSAPNKLYLVPGGVGAGSNMKMVHQVLAGIHILGASEAMGFAARLGLDARQTAKEIITSDAWTWMFENRVPRMIEEDWEPGASALTLILKDMGIITSSARQAHFATPLCSTAEQVYLAAVSHGHGAKDDSFMVRLYYQEPITQASVNGPVEDNIAALQLVRGLMLGTNLCGAAEAIAFARYLGVDMTQFYALASEAAGASQIFNSQGREMIEGRIGIRQAGERTLDQVIEVLQGPVQRARDLGCPLYLGNAALNLLVMAKTAGYGQEGQTSVIKLFGS